MEWITGGGSNEVDIGYVPLMTIFSTSPSVLWESESYSSNESFDDSSIIWDHEISVGQAVQEIEQTLYPFKKVSFCATNLRETWKPSSSVLPIHQVVYLV